jgi:predicted Zn-dependent protease
MDFRVLVLSAAIAVAMSLSGPALAQSNLSNDSLVRMSDNSLTQTGAGISSMRASGSISGSVRTLDNRPVGNARIEIRDTANGGAVAYGFTGPTGNFEVNNIPRGAYEVVATSGLSEAREEIRMDDAPVQFTLRLPHTGDSTSSPGQQTVSVQQLHVPDKAQAALRKAHDAADKGKLDEARQQIAKALTIDPKYSDALTFRGIVDLQTGNLNSAVDDLQKAIQLDNNSALAYIAMGSIYNLRNQYDDALRELDRGVALNPASWQAHYEISKAELGKGDFSTALKEVEKAQGLLGREFAPLHDVKGHALLGMKSYPDAVAEFQKYLSEDKDSPSATQIRETMESAKAFAEAKK